MPVSQPVYTRLSKVGNEVTLYLDGNHKVGGIVTYYDGDHIILTSQDTTGGTREIEIPVERIVAVSWLS